MTPAFRSWGKPLSRQILSSSQPSRVDDIAVDAFFGAAAAPPSTGTRHRAILFLSVLLCLGMPLPAWLLLLDTVRSSL